MTQIAVRCRYRIENVVERGFRAVRITLLHQLEAHRDVAAVTATRAAKSSAKILVVVVEHEPHLDPFQRIEHLAQRAAQHVEEGVRPGRTHIAFGNERVTLTFLTPSRPEVRPIVQREHDHRFTARRKSGTGIHVHVRVVCTGRARGHNHCGYYNCQSQFAK